MTPDAPIWTLSRLWDALKKLWFVVAAATLLGGVIAFGLSTTVTPVFRSTASLFFAISQGNTVSDLANGSTYTQSQMLSFAQLATSSRVLQPVVDQLNLDATPRELARSIAVTIPQSTSILEIEASALSGRDAANIANAVADSLTSVVREISPTNGDGSSPTIAAVPIDDAVVPQFQALPNKPRDAALGAAVGLMLGVLGAILWTMLDTRIPNEEVLRQTVSSPVLGSVSRARAARGERGLFVARDPLGQTSEDFRKIRSALAYADVVERSRTLLVTSPNPGEGKSTFSANLALTLAGLRNTVLLVDADLRRPRVGEFFGVESAVGLTSVLVGEAGLERARINRPGTSLDILTSGTIPPNPAEMLTSDAMRELLERTSEAYDFVIVDSPPVLSVADANLLAPLADGTIVVVDAKSTHRSSLSRAVASLESSGGRLIGVVLNRVRRGSRSSYYGDESIVDAGAA